MRILPPDLYGERDHQALLSFLRYCRDRARADNHFKVASISLEVKHTDPLAVLESIYEPNELHFYLECPRQGEAVAGAEAVLYQKSQGPGRFEKVRQFSESVLDHTIATGDLQIPFSGPHFFCAFTFFDDTEEEAFFPPATVFMPRWQVSCRADTYGAVANTVVEPDSVLEALAEKIWAAHKKFSAFPYSFSAQSMEKVLPAKLEINEVSRAGSFEEAVATALARIAACHYEKIVLARALNIISGAPLKPLDSLNRLRNTYPACYVFSIGNGLHQSFIGATPERLLQMQKGELQTEALAGSAPRGNNAREDAYHAHTLLDSAKELYEHQIVIDSIVRRLRSIGISPHIATRPQLLQLSNVQHLRTPICAGLPEGVHFLDILKTLHPTPAVGGTPRENALADIRQLESFDRGLYAGIVGWFDYRGRAEMVVAIRSALIDDNGARIYAGAGIVKGSHPEKEKKETDLKLEALLSALH